MGGLNQSVQARAGGAVPAAGVRIQLPAIPADAFRLDFEANPTGASSMKVVSPERARLQVWDGARMVHEDDVPTSFAANPDVFYRFVVQHHTDKKKAQAILGE